MLSAVSSYNNVYALLSTAQAANLAAPKASADQSGEDQRRGRPAVLVTLSAEARSALSAMPAVAQAPYGRYFPTRDGFSSTALAAAVTNPAAAPFSGGKSLDQVAAAARQSMNGKYAAMSAAGAPFDIDSVEGRDSYTLMGDLDRRALYAVSSNQDSQFSQDEQGIAQSIMGQQQGLAMGLYSGPASQAGTFNDPFVGDGAARFKAAVSWLDNVSNDEKTSIAWAASRADAQVSYERTAARGGGTPDNLDSDNPLARVVKAAMDTMTDDPARTKTTGRIASVRDLQAQPWFAGFAGQIDGAIARTRAMYQSRSLSISV